MSSSRKHKKAARHQPVTRSEPTVATTTPSDTSASGAESAPADANGRASSPVGTQQEPSTAAGARNQSTEQSRPRSVATISAAIDTMVQALDVEPHTRPTGTDEPDQRSTRGSAEDPSTAHDHGLDDDHDRWSDQSADHRRDEVGDVEQYGPAADGGRRPRGRVLIAIAIAAPLIFVGAFFAGGWIIDKGQAPPTTPTLVENRAVPSPAASATATDTAPKSSGALFVPGGTVGPGLTEPGALVRATPTADGSLEVVELVRFSEPVTELSLGPPLTKGLVARSRPGAIEIADLQVQADGAVVDTGRRNLTTGQTVQLPDAASTLRMRYRLTGSTVRSVPSTPGRALTVLPPITSPATLGSLPVVVEVSGAQVTNVLCPGLGTNLQLCGRSWSQGWYSPPQRAGRTAVLAQLDLPDPVG